MGRPSTASTAMTSNPPTPPFTGRRTMPITAAPLENSTSTDSTITMTSTSSKSTVSSPDAPRKLSARERSADHNPFTPPAHLLASSAGPGFEQDVRQQRLLFGPGVPESAPVPTAVSMTIEVPEKSSGSWQAETSCMPASLPVLPPRAPARYTKSRPSTSSSASAVPYARPMSSTPTRDSYGYTPPKLVGSSSRPVSRDGYGSLNALEQFARTASSIPPPPSMSHTTPSRRGSGSGSFFGFGDASRPTLPPLASIGSLGSLGSLSSVHGSQGHERMMLPPLQPLDRRYRREEYSDRPATSLGLGSHSYDAPSLTSSGLRRGGGWS
jgi:hypothetical protein